MPRIRPSSTPGAGPRGPPWTNILDLHTGGASLSPAASVQALLYALPFMTPGFICYDLADMRALLRAGPQARTTAVRWNHAPILPAAVANACLPLRPPQDGGAALAWIHTGPGFSMREFDALGEQLRRHLPKAQLLVADIHHAGWRKGRRTLSLTLVGDWRTA